MIKRVLPLVSAIAAGLLMLTSQAALATPTPDTGPAAGGTAVTDALPFGFTQIAAGGGHTVALGSDGRVYTWGRNNWGQLGNGTGGAGVSGTFDSTTPVPVDTSGVLAGVTVVAISANYYNSLALDSDGNVYTWGRNNYGQLGNGTGGSGLFSNVPVKVTPTGALSALKFSAVVGGDSHTVAVGTDGKVYTWGRDNYGQLGNGVGGGPSGTSDISTVPVAVSGPLATLTVASSGGGGYGPEVIAAGTYGSAALGSDGKLYAWGWGHLGQLGNGTDGIGVYSNLPVEVSLTGVLAGKTIAEVTNHGGDTFLARDDAGRVYSWGYNGYGQLGNGTSGSTANSNVPVEVTSTGVLAGVQVAALAAAGNPSIALGDNGVVYTWGRSQYGELGNGTSGGTVHSSEPVAVTGGALAGVTVTGIAAGYYHAAAIDEDGNAYTWGRNSTGQLGNGTTAHSSVPVLVDLSGSLLVTQVLFGSAAGTNLQQAATGWSAFTPDGCGTVDVTVDYTFFGTPTTRVYPDGFSYDIECQAELTLVKEVTSGTASPTRWSLTAAGPTPITGVTGAATVTDATVTPGTYTLTESGPAEYEQQSLACVDAEQATVPVSDAGQVALAAGQDVTCTFTNAAVPPATGTLTLVKELASDDADPTAWTLTAQGPTPITGVTGAESVTGVTVTAGAYTLTESGGPAGYEQQSLSCDVGGEMLPVAENVVQVGSGEAVTCTFTNHAVTTGDGTTPGPPQVLADSGAVLSAAASGVALLLLVGGGTLILASRRHRTSR
ncbi:MAG: hypothetical protein ACK5H2_13095 [Beutenbergiaceae bacterium]